MDQEQAQQEFIALIPESGEVEYEQVYNQLISTGKADAARHFHRLRRAGAFAVRVEGVKSFLSRAQAQE